MSCYRLAVLLNGRSSVNEYPSQVNTLHLQLLTSTFVSSIEVGCDPFGVQKHLHEGPISDYLAYHIFILQLITVVKL